MKKCDLEQSLVSTITLGKTQHKYEVLTTVLLMYSLIHVCEGRCIQITSGVKSILKLYLSKSIVTDGKSTRSKVESIN